MQPCKQLKPLHSCSGEGSKIVKGHCNYEEEENMVKKKDVRKSGELEKRKNKKRREDGDFFRGNRFEM